MSGVAAPAGALARALAAAGATAVTAAPAGVDARAERAGIARVAEALAGHGAELQLLAAADTRAAGDGFTLAYLFAPPGGRPLATVLVDVPA
ncbi:MAG TPA: hypothetical protein VFX28_18640, partial [Methylomirabilota bacterium]|nr:hypothetical protein [Methylomirabilota bacterium]